MDYQVVYDAANASFPLEDLVIFLFILAICVYWIIRRNHLPKGWREIGLLLAGFGVIFSLCVGIILVSSKLSGYNKVQDTIRNGSASMVEGPVENFTVSSGDNVNSFIVQDAHFRYSRYSETFGYHVTQAEGGPIKDGIIVRIHYTDIEGDPSTPVILKLEIKR
jgi:hypothetical protein